VNERRKAETDNEWQTQTLGRRVKKKETHIHINEHLNLSPRQTHHSSLSSFFLTTLRISPRIKRHNIPRRGHTHQSRRHGNIILTGAARGEVAAARRGFIRRGQREEGARRVDSDIMGRNAEEAPY
jgi:hypothetical protein